MSDQITREQARRLAAYAYELGWRHACDDHLTQRHDPQHPIGAGMLHGPDAILYALERKDPR